MFQNYLLITVRNITRNKLYSFINFGGLAIGFAACLLIYLFVKDRYLINDVTLEDLKTINIDEINNIKSQHTQISYDINNMKQELIEVKELLTDFLSLQKGR